MAFFGSGTKAIVTVGYNEDQTGVYSFDTAAPQTPSGFTPHDQFVTWSLAATDNNRVYVANTGGDDNHAGWDSYNSCFIYSYNMAGAGQTFANGTSVTTYYVKNRSTYPSCIDVYRSATATRDPAFVAQHRATGLAVQQGGNVLAVAHKGLNQINLFHKTTGASLGSIAVAAPGRIAFNAANGHLWVLSGTSVLRYTDVGAGNTLSTTISGLAFPLALGVDPVTNNVLVADGGSSQQVKGFASSGGAALWTLGTAGGYSAANGPDVTNTKFMFTITNNGTNPLPFSFLAVQSDGSFWVGDGGNCRILHFSSSRAYLNQISAITDNLLASVDPNNPSRVFALGWLEYQFDYSKVLNPGDPNAAGGNGSWKLVKNWMAGIDPTQYAGFTTVTTLTSGGQTRTYAQVAQKSDYAGGDYHAYNAVAELPATGPLRFAYSASPTPVGQAMWIAPNGDIRYSKIAGGVMTVYKKAFTGINGPGNPVWSAETPIASAPAAGGDPARAYGNGDSWGSLRMTFPITVGDMVISFRSAQGTVSYPDYHLGGIPLGGTGWQFKTSKALNITSPDGKGSYTTQNSYGGHNGTNAWSVGNNVVWNYDGQYGTFSNQYAHYWDDGLFIGQFGTSTSPDHATHAPAGYSGNFSQTTMVAGPDGNLYAFSADECIHAGVHVWRIGNLNSIVAFAASGTLGQSETLLLNSPGEEPPSEWTSQDVGSPGQAGSSSYANGLFTVSGGGNDIFGTSDKFQYDSMLLTGDGSIVARVDSQTNTHAWAKAGPMFRGSNAANSAHASVFVSPSNGVSFQWRTAAGGSTSSATVPGVSAPQWLKLTREGNSFTAFYGSDGIAWTQIGTPQTIASMPAAPLAGLAVTSHHNGTLSTAVFSSVTVGAPPSEWSSGDIGLPAQAGSTTLAGGVFTVSGSGSDIFGTSDKFHYHRLEHPGDGSIVAHITSQTNTHAWAKAGLMFRGGNAADSPHASVFVSPSNGVSFQWRNTAGGSSASATVAGITAPLWVKMTRSGAGFTAYYSTDGTAWIQMGTAQTIGGMPATALAGLAVTSHNNTTLSTATFSGVSIAP